MWYVTHLDTYGGKYNGDNIMRVHSMLKHQLGLIKKNNDNTKNPNKLKSPFKLKVESTETVCSMATLSPIN